MKQRERLFRKFHRGPARFPTKVSKLDPGAKLRFASNISNPEWSMQNHVPINTSKAHSNHIPDEIIGMENIPAPTAVPATIVTPGNREMNSFN